MGPLLSPCSPLWTGKLRATRRSAASGATVGQKEPPMGVRMQPQSEMFFTLLSSTAGPDVVTTHEHGVELALKELTDAGHDDG